VALRLGDPEPARRTTSPGQEGCVQQFDQRRTRLWAEIRGARAIREPAPRPGPLASPRLRCVEKLREGEGEFGRSAADLLAAATRIVPTVPTVPTVPAVPAMPTMPTMPTMLPELATYTVLTQ
jgi:hypothetical protein